MKWIIYIHSGAVSSSSTPTKVSLNAPLYIHVRYCTCKFTCYLFIWNLSTMNTIGTCLSVLIKKLSSFQRQFCTLKLHSRKCPDYRNVQNSECPDQRMFICISIFIYSQIELKEFIKLGRCVYSIEVNNDHVNLLPCRNIETITDNEVYYTHHYVTCYMWSIIVHYTLYMQYV